MEKTKMRKAGLLAEEPVKTYIQICRILNKIITYNIDLLCIKHIHFVSSLYKRGLYYSISLAIISEVWRKYSFPNAGTKFP